MTKRMAKMRTLNVWVLTSAMLSASLPAMAQTPAGQTPQAGGTTSASPQAAQERYVVGQAKPPVVPGAGPMMDMTLAEAVRRALERNLDIQVQKLNPEMNDYSLQAARAAYRPTLSTTQFAFNDRTQASTSQLDFGGTVATKTTNYNMGVNQSLPWYGGSYNFSFQNSRVATTSATATRNPQFSANFNFSYTQPILQNRSIDNTRATIRTDEILRQISDIQLATTIANTVAQVKEAYWDLRAALEQIEISRAAFGLANRLVQDNNTKVEVGTLAKLDVLQAQSSAASRDLAVTQAIAAWQQRELAFKRLIAAGPQDDAYKATINPTDRLDFAQQSVDIQGAINKALAQRSDLAQARKNIESSDINIELLKGQVLPSLNLTGGYSAAGTGGPVLTRSGLGGAVTSITPGGYGDAFSSAFTYPTWNLQLNFTYPIGQVAAKANLARANLSLTQQQVQLKVTELTVATDVTTAALNVTNGYASVQSAQKALDLAEQTAQAEQSKFNVGLSTNYNVLQTQNDLNTARVQSLNAIITYIKALIEYERLQNVK